MDAQCSSARIPPCDQPPIWRHPKTGYVYCDKCWQAEALRFEHVIGIRLDGAKAPMSSFSSCVMDFTLGVILIFYILLFLAFWLIVGSVQIAVRRYRMKLPSRFAYLDCHAQGHQFGLSENICEHCGAERFDEERLRISIQKI